LTYWFRKQPGEPKTGHAIKDAYISLNLMKATTGIEPADSRFFTFIIGNDSNIIGSIFNVLS